MSIVTYFWRRLWDAGMMESATLAFALVRHSEKLLPLIFVSPNHSVGRYVRARPEILELTNSRFISKNWNVAEKFRRAVGHVEIIETMGGLLNFEPDQIVDLITLPAVGSAYRLTLDQARWFFREGQLVFSLWEGVDRIFSVSFSFGTENGRMVAYVGGIQGRRQNVDEENILDRYRRFTKAAFGCRPRDFIIEAFRALCRSIAVNKILAVADNNHPLQGIDGLFLSYDEVWKERGAMLRDDGFYDLPVNASNRALSDIPVKKRSLYRKRLALFDQIEIHLSERLAQSLPNRLRPSSRSLY